MASQTLAELEACPISSKRQQPSLMRAGRCDFFAGADYRTSSALFKRTCLLLDGMIADIKIAEEKWGQELG